MQATRVRKFLIHLSREESERLQSLVPKAETHCTCFIVHDLFKTTVLDCSGILTFASYNDRVGMYFVEATVKRRAVEEIIRKALAQVVEDFYDE